VVLTGNGEDGGRGRAFREERGFRGTRFHRRTARCARGLEARMGRLSGRGM